MHRHLLKTVWQLPQAALKRFFSDLLRILLLSRRPQRMAKAGFVLPTTVLLTLMVVLTATALTYRAFSRSEQAITQREQKVIVNAATPAIDRAKAKIEFLFREDPRFPSGLPASDILYDLMSTKLDTKEFAGYTGRVSLLQGGVGTGAVDPYTLPDETRVDINNDGKLDNAWSFPSEGKTIVYSILVDDAVDTKEANNPGVGENFLPRSYVKSSIGIEAVANQAKADALITRTGPLATTEATPQCKGALSEGGWQVVTQGSNSDLQKNFQVNAFVANDQDVNQTFETLEFQQSRQASRANKWGAWFRYDLEVFPGAEFNWNGAMHTDGNFIVNRDEVRFHMVSSHNSCVYGKEASEITLSARDLDGTNGINPQSGSVPTGGFRDFQGQVVKGTMRDDNYPAGDNPIVHVFAGNGTRPTTTDTLTAANHSVSGGRPSDVSVNALTLFTRDETQHINVNSWTRRAAWDTAANPFGEKSGGRAITSEVIRPFVDDFYRADNRWGPKPRYDNRTSAFDIANQPSGTTIGDKITGLGQLTDKATGLDGYWERQAIRGGLRLIMGQRLELGNNVKWGNDPTAGVVDGNANTKGDPLYPAKIKPSANARFGGPHEYLQRKTLQDNLAAVQGMAVYHYQISNGEFPAVCMVMTSHPGTRQSIVNSRTFNPYTRDTSRIRTDFFNGQGTNGWEFKFPEGFDTDGEFGQELAKGKPLGNGLRNLAYFAGDPDGGAPSFKPKQDKSDDTAPEVHPAPYLSMWGDFSPLRRILTEFDAATGTAKDRYDALSPADKATLHSAACTLSLLAYNIDSDYNEATTLLSSENSKFQNISTQLRNGMSDIIAYLENASQDPGNKIQALFTRLKNFGDYKAERNWVDPNPATVLPNPVDKDGNPILQGGNPVLSACPAGTDAAGFQPACDVGEFFAGFTLRDWLITLDEVTTATGAYDNATGAVSGEIQEISVFSKTITESTSSLRDRELGFREGKPKTTLSVTNAAKNIVPWNATTGYTTELVSIKSEAYPFQTRCSPNLFTDVIAKGTGGKDDQVALSLVVCSDDSTQISPVKYPSLFYLFPLVQHDLKGTGNYAQPDGVAVTTQPAEEYITNAYVNKVNPAAVKFEVVGSDPVTGLKDIAAKPSSITSPATNWTVPVTASTGLLTPTNVDQVSGNAQPQAFKINIGTTVVRVPFLDKGLFDGREQLNTRVLDIDIEALSTRKTSAGDFWLSADREKQAEGVVYAFREDAVREDEVTRPRNASATTCDQPQSGAINPVRFKIEKTENCRMRVIPGTVTQDPPLTARGISLKPVDFIADPERRPYGFRLRTASGNPSDFSGPSFARKVGMTLVSDNSVYIQGNFNLHSTNGTTANIVEEFTQTLWDKTLANAFGNRFYDDRTTLNTGTFANLEKDRWRPVEILSDAISILSSGFLDGAVEDGFLKARPTAEGGDANTSSYMNQNRPIFVNGGTELTTDMPADSFTRQNGTGTPVYVDRNGTYYAAIQPGGTPLSPVVPFYSEYNADNRWVNFLTGDGIRRRNVQTAETTFVNAVFVSGIVPKRPKQSYGGLHNYPRFLEEWSGIDLHIAGSFIQLNFATASTGPYEQDAWEEGTDPVDAEPIGYYDAPNRRWGYDVGLLYVPPAPAARRFVTIGSPRSEYYREIAADDPYIKNLRCAKDKSGKFILNGLCNKS